MIQIFSYTPYGGSEINVRPTECPSFPYEFKIKDSSIKSAFQDGSTFNRPRFTKMRRQITLKFDYLIGTDKDEFKDLEIGALGVQNFKYWGNFPDVVDKSTPVDDDTDFVNVILSEPISYELVMRTEVSDYWNLIITIEDV